VLDRAPFLGCFVEEALDAAHIRLRLCQLFPGRAHQGISILPDLLGAAADAADIAVESGPLLRIQIQLRRGATTMTISWPLSAAADFGAWMRELLR